MADPNKFEKNSPAYIENLYAEYCKTKKMADGGKVKNDESGNTIAGISTSTPEGHDLAVNYLGARDRAINSHRGYDSPKSTGTGMGDVKFQDSLENPDVVNGYADGGEAASDNDSSTLEQLYQKFKDATAPKSGSGMGDVQRADAASRALPVMTQGFGSPQADDLAQQMQTSRAGQPGATNVTPQDVSNFQQNVGAATGSVSAMTKVADLEPEIQAFLAKKYGPDIAKTMSIDNSTAQELKDTLNKYRTSSSISTTPKPNYAVPQAQAEAGLATPPIISPQGNAPVPKMAKGGEVEKPHDKKNLKKLKQSFVKFVKEEGQQKTDGGIVEGSPLEGADKAIDAEQNTQHAIDHDSKIPVSSYTKLSPDMGDVQYAERLRQRNKDAGYANGGTIKGVTGGGSVMFGNTVIADHQRPALGYKNAPKYKTGTSNPNIQKFDNGGQVSGPNPDPDQEKSAQEKIIDILHRVTNPQLSMGNMFDIPGDDKAADLLKQALPNYADGSDGAIKEEKVEGPEQDVNTQAVMRGMYIPDDQAQSDEENKAEQMAGSTDDAASELANDTSTPGQAAVVIDQPKQDVRQLPADTITSDDAGAQALSDAEQDVADRKQTTEDENVPSDQDTSDDGKSAAEAAQPLLEKADPTTQSSILQQLLSAQQQQKAILEGEQGAKYGALLAAGQAGHGAKPASPEYLTNPDLAKLPVQNFMQQLAMDKEDPNSPISKTYQDHILAGLPNATPQQIANIRGSSADNLDKFLPQQTKLIYGQNAINNRNAMTDKRIQATKDLTQTRNDFTAQQNQLKMQNDLKGKQMLADAMGLRATAPQVTAGMKAVQNDQTVKALDINQAALAATKNAKDSGLPVNQQILSDFNTALTQTLGLKPGAITQTRYSNSTMSDLQTKLQDALGKASGDVNYDLRKDDPVLYKTLSDWIDFMYGETSRSKMQRVQQLSGAYSTGFKAGGLGGAANALDAASKQFGANPYEASQPTPPSPNAAAAPTGAPQTQMADAVAAEVARRNALKAQNATSTSDEEEDNQ